MRLPPQRRRPGADPPRRARGRRRGGNLRRQACHPRRDAITGRDALTASELRVARLAADGLTNREIAQALFITGRTAKVHLNRVCHKLEITRPGQLASALTSPLDDRGERPSATATIS